MQRSTTRILTTHCGSLARPKDLLDLMKARVNGEPCDLDVYSRRVAGAVAEVVHKQVENGIDIPNDGEQGKLGFFSYVSERLGGFTAGPGPRPTMFGAEVDAFPEYYKQYFSQAMLGSSLTPMVPLVCTGPVSYRGQETIGRDIRNLKAAIKGLKYEDVFMPAVAPSGVGTNAYYRQTKNTSMRWRRPCAPSIRRLPKPASWFRSTTRFSLSSTVIQP